MFRHFVAGSVLLSAVWTATPWSNALAEEVPIPVKQRTERLWPEEAPSAKGASEKDIPTLTVYPAPGNRSDATGVVICPGGGYGGLASDYEGSEVAEWLNSAGMAAFVLRYRVAPYRHPVPLTDAHRALRTVRAKAAEWGVNPNRIGILGFSAGGHLAASAGTHFDAGQSASDDPVERVGSRPDFMVLIYPVISMSEPYCHRGSRRNLLGRHPSPELVADLSCEKQVCDATPPTFLVSSSDDAAVPVENSLLLYAALRKAGVPAELHVYQHGPHGFGLGKGDPALSTWPGLCLQWLHRQGL